MEKDMQKIKIGKYDDYVDSGVEWLGEIPSCWELTRLGTRFIERRSKVSDKDYSALSVTKNGIVPQLASAAKTNDGDNRKLVKEGDFVINSRSDRKGSSGIAFQDGSVSLINIVMRPLGINPLFCNYLLKSYNFIEEFYRMGHGIVADLWTTRYDEMRSIMIAIPSLSEQTAIAKFLDDKCEKIDKAIIQKQKLISLLKESKQILIQNAVTKGIDPNVELVDSGIDWIGKIPSHWQVKKLRHVGCTQNGISAGSDYFGEGYPFVSYGDVYNNIELQDTVKGLAKSSDGDRLNYSVKKGDVFFTRTSETVEEIGFTSTCLSTLKDATFAGFLIRFRPVKNKLVPSFSKYYFSSVLHRAFFVKEMNLVIRASLSQELLKKLPVMLPSLSEQKEIAIYIASETKKIEKAISLQEKQIEKLKEYKTTLINSAVTGKIKVY